jgi:hypothetical protein
MAKKKSTGKKRGVYNKNPSARIAREVGRLNPTSFDKVAAKLLSMDRGKAVAIVLGEISRTFALANKGSGLKG